MALLQRNRPSRSTRKIENADAEPGLVHMKLLAPADAAIAIAVRTRRSISPKGALQVARSPIKDILPGHRNAAVRACDALAERGRC